MSVLIYKRQPFPVVTYFFQILPCGPIKIGRSNDVAKRFASLAGSFPYPIVPLMVLPGDYERYLHFAYIETRMNGEWFRPTHSLTRLITSLIPHDPDYMLVGGREVVVGRKVSKTELSSIARQLIGPRRPKSKQKAERKELCQHFKSLRRNVV